MFLFYGVNCIEDFLIGAMADDLISNGEIHDNDQAIPDVDGFSRMTLGALMNTIKSSSGMPNGGDDFDFYSSFPQFRKFSCEQGSRIINTINSFLNHQGLKRLPALETESVGGHALNIDDKSDCIIEANDTMLEQISALLEEVSSKSKKKESIYSETNQENTATIAVSKPIVSSWNRKNKYGKQQTFRLFHAHNIARPQLKFKDKIDNSNVPFVPKISEKPNFIKPLPQALIDLHKMNLDSNIPLAITHLVRQGRKYGTEDQRIYDHPYEMEINALKYPNSQLLRVIPQRYYPFPTEPCELIRTKEELLTVIDHLKTCTELAVDLEHHSYRSFQGITCLMQISSRTEDFLIDTLELRHEIHLLNQVFTDPNIVKVFHGANSDILWLQRDFGVYVVNMFDTSQASRELSLPRFSLDYLLQTYCSVNADKKYQLADWRIRPIPNEMRKYAQEDTHYLLYIYDLMKNKLLDMVGECLTSGTDTSKLLNVLHNSQKICLQKYEKFLITPKSYLELYERQHKKQLNGNQLELLRSLFSWRDTMARQEDENPGYVLPKHMLFQIAEIMPKEAQGILACCNPVPPLVRQHVHVVHQLVLEARAKAFIGKTNDSSNVKTTFQVPVPAKPDSETYNDILTCPHDMSHEHTKLNEEKYSSPNILAVPQSSFLGVDKNGNAHGKIHKISNGKWEPFAKFFPTNAKSGSVQMEKAAISQAPLTLKSMLSPGFVWKLRQLGEEKKTKNHEQDTPIQQPGGRKRLNEYVNEDVSGLWKKKMSNRKHRKVHHNFKAHEYERTHYDRFLKK